MELKLAFIGFGNVARAFARMLNEREPQLSEQYDLSWRTTAIATARHGSIISNEDICFSEAIDCVESGASIKTLLGSSSTSDAAAVVEGCDADILFETTPLDPTSGEPATTFIRRALRRRINVVTANKGPVAFAYHELKSLAHRHGVMFRFEAAVMDGAPIFNLYEYCLPAVRIEGFYGILNSTTNFILSGIEQGRSFDECLLEAQRLGIVEANADYDIDGWDAAVKAVALANVLMGARVQPQEVERRGIRDITRQELETAAERDLTVRLIARAERGPDGPKVSVVPEIVPVGSLLGSVRGTSNVLVIKTDLMGEIAIVENNPGIEQTAYALLSDMIAIHNYMKET